MDLDNKDEGCTITKGKFNYETFTFESEKHGG